MNWKVSHVSGSHTQEVCSCINFVHFEMIYGVSWDRRFPEGNREGLCRRHFHLGQGFKSNKFSILKCAFLLHVKLDAHFYKPVRLLEDR